MAVSEYGAVPRWMQLGPLVLCVAGLGVSIYLTYEHFTSSTTLACPDTGTINCAKVTTSSYSAVFGIPVALLGLLFFVAMLPLLVPRAWNAGERWVHQVRLGMVVLGILFVLYLVWAELFRIHAICLWCTGVHVLTGGLFALVVFAEAFREPARR